MWIDLQVTRYIRLWIDLQDTRYIMWVYLQDTRYIMWINLQDTRYIRLWIVLQDTRYMRWIGLQDTRCMRWIDLQDTRYIRLWIDLQDTRYMRWIDLQDTQYVMWIDLPDTRYMWVDLQDTRYVMWIDLQDTRCIYPSITFHDSRSIPSRCIHEIVLFVLHSATAQSCYVTASVSCVGFSFLSLCWVDSRKVESDCSAVQVVYSLYVNPICIVLTHLLCTQLSASSKLSEMCVLRYRQNKFNRPSPLETTENVLFWCT